MEEMLENVKEYVIDEYVEDDTEITYDTPLITGGIVDSFSMVSLKRFLENKYEISIPDSTPISSSGKSSHSSLPHRCPPNPSLSRHLN